MQYVIQVTHDWGDWYVMGVDDTNEIVTQTDRLNEAKKFDTWGDANFFVDIWKTPGHGITDVGRLLIQPVKKHRTRHGPRWRIKT